jgi:hypothetical protein
LRKRRRRTPETQIKRVLLTLVKVANSVGKFKYRRALRQERWWGVDRISTVWIYHKCLKQERMWLKVEN